MREKPTQNFLFDDFKKDSVIPEMLAEDSIKGEPSDIEQPEPQEEKLDGVSTMSPDPCYSTETPHPNAALVRGTTEKNFQETSPEDCPQSRLPAAQAEKPVELNYEASSDDEEPLL